MKFGQPAKAKDTLTPTGTRGLSTLMSREPRVLLMVARGNVEVRRESAASVRSDAAPLERRTP
jgi:hypothetical protein